MDKKPCKNCGVVKPLTSFYKRTPSRDGRRGVCKKCYCANSAAYIASLPESEKAIRRLNCNDWRSQNRERVKQLAREYRQKNKKKLSDYEKKYQVIRKLRKGLALENLEVSD